ncbi:FAD/NAD(P)-binding domain-containing protein [Aspergillus steynii IBT 23096]|uniref:FAD/NAD(P)-binding domain-containing protein n=1 Tax=Aspergillus steynii IBT 23096 TaxID=1392250 RepID=A0A2I2FUE9_9EURO|nr:FAD/NAD(P)-binding domain-containing protein [Aspergillus steynii IBT 23096]PLB44275.1 FAD/NAD(P)-binding domain-containing protein [Aspergillus steynii IBT 23096]
MRYMILSSLATAATAVTVIDRDFVVLGGGSSGTYAAVQLVDRNQSVVVVEKQGRLGGATLTYYDPSTKKPFDYGVQFFNPLDVVTEYFERLGISTGATSASGTSVFADFAEGILLPNLTYTYGADYDRELEKYPYLASGYHLPDDIPEDLLLPWVEYIEKHNLTTSAIGSFRQPNPAGNPLQRLAVHEFNGLNRVMVDELNGHAIHQTDGDNSAIYTKATSIIGSDNLLLNATISSANRTDSGIQLHISTPDGDSLIRAKQLLVAAPPDASNLSPLSLDSREKSTLSEIAGYPFYVGIVSNTGLPDDYSFKNVGAKTQYHVPDLPFVVTITASPHIPGVFSYAYSSLKELTQSEVQDAVTEAIENLRAQLTNKGSDTDAVPKYLEFRDVGPFHPEQSADAIRNGFWKDMYALQGYRNTWYISGLFVLNSAQLWNNTQALLPEIIDAAQKLE